MKNVNMPRHQESSLHHLRRLEMELIVPEIASEGARFERILEIGSGDGFQLNYLVQLGGKIFPSDISTDRLGALPTRFVIDDWPNGGALSAATYFLRQKSKDGLIAK